MTDYKQLCAELLAALEEEASNWNLTPEDHPLVERARAALAEPEPEGPTDEEIMELMPAEMHDDFAAAARAMAEQAGIDSTRVRGLHRIILNSHAVDLARAVLARWGRPTPQPIPVSERLPGPGDCDAEGRCWLCGKVEGDWRLINPEKSGVPQLRYCFSHWLPAHALPLPLRGKD